MTTIEVELPADTVAGQISKQILLDCLDELECIGAVQKYTITTECKASPLGSKRPVES